MISSIFATACRSGRWSAARMVFKEVVKIIQAELSRVTTRNTKEFLNWYLILHGSEINFFSLLVTRTIRLCIHVFIVHSKSHIQLLQCIYWIGRNDVCSGQPLEYTNYSHCFFFFAESKLKQYFANRKFLKLYVRYFV